MSQKDFAKRTFLGIGAIAVLASVGCAGQALREIQGAKAEVHLVDSSDPGALLSRFQDVQFRPATALLPAPVVSQTMLSEMDSELGKIRPELREKFPGGQPVLTIDNTILFFQRKGLFSGGFLLSHLRMTGEGRTVLEGVIHVESQSFQDGGEQDLANTAAKALRDILDKKGK